ncbi:MULTISPECIES: formyltetrahydrofolate deformylase [Rhodobacterales]|uniref:formyltetrahydrofolate deformylase n=1 Tax=Roseobacter sp. N2S TaxID=2663844 RepID=UPI0028589B04|nr:MULTISPECIES: formyltetrahydrofolate deformylase [Rhodobacterales]MDR6263492.1 formyltetrahydrofolate deformylase [Roseobacter sp. N2S]
MSRHVLTLSCKNRIGIVAAAAQALADADCNIVDAQQFDDSTTDNFFMRVEFDGDAGVAGFETSFQAIATRFDMEWSLRAASEKRRVLIMVSKFDHCLVDLLYRARIGELNIEVVGIVSNHPLEAIGLTEDPAIPFHHLPVTRETKAAQEAQIQALIEETGAELVILARYMQVLSGEFSTYLSGRCINIHHSFLPGFKGAKPYHQAHALGAKMIGATAHYVTGDLDEGPIISQDVERVCHSDTPEDLIRIGRDIERRVLARAVSNHLEDRVLLNGNRTVVFRR